MAARKTPSKGGKPDKIMRDALSVELHIEDEIEGQLVRRYRRVARALVARGMEGDVSAIKEINERMDGKVPQALVGDKEHDPIQHSVTALLQEIDGKTRGLK